MMLGNSSAEKKVYYIGAVAIWVLLSIAFYFGLVNTPVKDHLDFSVLAGLGIVMFGVHGLSILKSTVYMQNSLSS